MGGSCRELGHQSGSHALDPIPNVVTDFNRCPVHERSIVPTPRRLRKLNTARPQFLTHAIALSTLDDQLCQPLLRLTRYGRGPP
jgi:hypothetical protein